MLQGLCHSKQLLLTQGIDSFKEYFLKKLFTFDNQKVKKGAKPKKNTFAKQLKETPEYKDIAEYVESKLNENHPKLEKVTHLLQEFFSHPKNQERQSKVIVFVQYRESAKEIKRYLENNIEPKGLVRPDIFLG